MLKRNSCIWAVLVLLNSGFVSSGAEDPFKMSYSFTFTVRNSITVGRGGIGYR